MSNNSGETKVRLNFGCDKVPWVVHGLAQEIGDRR